MGNGVFEWSNFKFGIRYKIFIVIFAVVAYLLASSIFMGVTQANNIQKAQLEENLKYWVDGLSSFMTGSTGTVDDNRENNLQPAYYISDELSANARLLLFEPNGNIINGDISLVSEDQKQQILSADSSGIIHDSNNTRIIYYKPIPEIELIISAVGTWGGSSVVYANTRNTAIALLFATIILTMVATYLLVNDINTPLNRILQFLKAISTGDMSRNLNAYSEDEIGDFVKQLARTTALLESKTERANDLLANIEQAAKDIEENASQVQLAAEEQASGVSEQASAVEEALSVSSEIVATSRQIAENADDVQRTAENNLMSCKRGTERVDQAVTGFKNLGEYVEDITDRVIHFGEDIRKISGVIDIIEEVAVQISLLALNAQIEAAGAGEEGKRFGVVAEEVGRLADNTMEALKQISEMVSNTLEATEHVVESARKGGGQLEVGKEVADAVGSSFEDIEKQADETVVVASKIAIITSQQTTASEQMAETISSIHTSAQQIKSNTKEVLNSMEKLSRTASRLANALAEE